MQLQESGENYLETILILMRKKPVVRSIDIVNETGYSKPSISRAVGILKDNDYIEVDESGCITLTALGEKIASSIYERHTILTQFLITIGVNERTAAEDACRIEHVISEETFDKIKDFSSSK
ncbi:MAG: metal-dependent transcriptional regulator [Eubacteriales bacterium]|nr:metal-dependent transcriptional regulator [Eubacteriales bacterium]MDD4421442.1 metal-dependent transcriptional regulator [Eubacteriales bacterium]HBR32378.1 DtxR family transcriptional regulator [Clostridiales bacterium]